MLNLATCVWLQYITDTFNTILPPLTINLVFLLIVFHSISQWQWRVAAIKSYQEKWSLSPQMSNFLTSWQRRALEINPLFISQQVVQAFRLPVTPKHSCTSFMRKDGGEVKTKELNLYQYDGPVFYFQLPSRQVKGFCPCSVILIHSNVFYGSLVSSGSQKQRK